MSLHVSSGIQLFFLASLAFGFGISFRRAVKNPSFLAGAGEVGVQRGGVA